MRERDEFADYAKKRTAAVVSKAPAQPAQPTVTVVVGETHDGKPCDCIDKTMVLSLGSEIELEHICHDGRVDKVVARVVAFSTPAPIAPEHGTAKKS